MPKNKALKPKRPFLISSLLKPMKNAVKFINNIAANPDKPTNGEKKVTIKIINAKTLFSEKNIKL